MSKIFAQFLPHLHVRRAQPVFGSGVSALSIVRFLVVPGESSTLEYLRESGD